MNRLLFKSLIATAFLTSCMVQAVDVRVKNESKNAINGEIRISGHTAFISPSDLKLRLQTKIGLIPKEDSARLVEAVAKQQDPLPPVSFKLNPGDEVGIGISNYELAQVIIK